MNLDLHNFFDLIKDISYILVKIDTPYVPEDFPDQYAVGKDLDIIVDKNDMVLMKQIVEKYADKYKNNFVIAKKDLGDGFCVRFKDNGRLHFQLDIACRVKGLDKDFVRESIENRKPIGSYFVAEERYEMIYRYVYYKKKKRKKYHLKYIRDNISKKDNELLKKANISFKGID